MANFYKKNFRKKIIPSRCKGGNYPQKGAPKATVALGASLFCPRHQRVNIHEDQICSNCSFIGRQTFIRKIVEKKLFPLGAKGENTLKKGPPKQRLLWGPLFVGRVTAVFFLGKVTGV